MNKVFGSIGHFIGRTVLAALGIVHKAEQVADADIPEIETLLADGASVATLIPGIGPNVAQILNAGVAVLAAVKATIDNTVEMEATVTAQVAAMAPAGYSFTLIKQDVVDDVKILFAEYEAEFEAAKAAALKAKAAV
jgi:hypothetical protein